MVYRVCPKSTALTLAAFLLVAAPGSVSADLSDKEVRKLNAGKLILHRKSERRGDFKLTGGRSWQTINRSPTQTWRALTRLSQHHKIVPGATRSSRVSSSKNVKRIEFIHEKGPLEISYQVDLGFDDEARVMKIWLIPDVSPNVRGGWGFAKIRPWYGGRTLLSFGAMVDIGDGFLTGFIRPAVQHWLLRVPEDIRRYVEASTPKQQ